MAETAKGCRVQETLVTQKGLGGRQVLANQLELEDRQALVEKISKKWFRLDRKGCPVNGTTFFYLGITLLLCFCCVVSSP